MNTIEFIPKEFNDVKLGYYETGKNPCSPGYPQDITEVLWNKTVIKTPQKIICTINNDTLVPVIPVCGVYIVTFRRELRYYDSVNMLHIRKTDKEDWFTGEIVEKDLQYEFPVFPPNHEEEEREMEREREAAQKYSDEELEEGQASGGFFNVNLMEYIEMPFEPGIYEIYFSTGGLESNRAFVEIIFEGDAERQSMPPGGTNTPGGAPGIAEEEDLPRI